VSDDDIKARIKASIDAFNALPPEQQAEMIRQQRRSFVRAEAGFGSDKIEAEYAAAYRLGDAETLKRLDAEAKERMRAADAIMDKMGI
jgi:hypothetical protein